jgi:hypothetical protein
MSYKKNAGRRRGVRGMAWAKQDASDVARSKELHKFLERKHQETQEALDLVLPALPLRLRLGLSLAFTSGAFDLGIKPPRSVVTIDSGMGKSPFEAPYGVPPVFAPRSNDLGETIEQRREERNKYYSIEEANEYPAQMPQRDKWGQPTWPADVKLVDGRHPDAGEWGKLCYRTACQKPHAFYYNKGTYKHYCKMCADLINKENMSGVKLCFLTETEVQHV